MKASIPKLDTRLLVSRLLEAKAAKARKQGRHPYEKNGVPYGIDSELGRVIHDRIPVKSVAALEKLALAASKKEMSKRSDLQYRYTLARFEKDEQGENIGTVVQVYQIMPPALPNPEDWGSGYFKNGKKFPWSNVKVYGGHIHIMDKDQPRFKYKYTELDPTDAFDTWQRMNKDSWSDDHPQWG